MPAGSVVNLRFAAANRDEREFERATELDLERAAPEAHLGVRLRRPLLPRRPARPARAYWGFKALIERIDEMWFIEGANDFRYQPNYFLRALRQLHIGFRRAA